MNHLAAMLLDMEYQRRDVEYIATTLWAIGRTVGGENFSIPAYSEFIHPTPKDARSKDQIIGNLIDKLTKGGDGE